MGGRIVAGDGPVRRHREDGVALDEHGAHRHLARLFRAARGLQGEAHEIDVVA